MGPINEECLRAVKGRNIIPNPDQTSRDIQGLLVAAVDPSGIAAELGIEPGDRVLSIDEHIITDILDYQYAIGEACFTLVVSKAGGDELWEFDVERDPEETLGISFAEMATDGLKTCRNNCVFCFVRQMPPGLRASLYEFDDDYRLSASLGNYITLTNMSEQEFDRIIDLRVSPLYISVHSWDTQIRARMMGNPHAINLPENLRRLARAGIVMHTQIVLVPGYNDKVVLRHTVEQLGKLYPQVQSIGVVPVGLTRFRFDLEPLRVLTPQECSSILVTGKAWQQDFRRRYEKNLVYFADEFYLACGNDIPPPEEYDGFDQLENGIGLLSSFENELADLLTNCRKPMTLKPIHVVTGLIAEPFLNQSLNLVQRYSSLCQTPIPPVRIHGIRNDFFGSRITVAGLVTATDIAAQMGDLGGEAFMIPRVMLRAGTQEFLDGHTVAWLEKRLNGPARIVNNTAEGFLHGILDQPGGLND
ncbi:MAG: DUF512 domain-containing protein [Peptococcaceae bacterium]|nr:DUF512 domain-containing protein [Peptococcaceae bacterium]